VYLKAKGMRMHQDVLGSESQISSNDRRPHFGLSDATDAGTAEIHWPSSARETVRLSAVDDIYTITKGQEITVAMCNSKPCSAVGLVQNLVQTVSVNLSLLANLPKPITPWGACLVTSDYSVSEASSGLQTAETRRP
jgi:hypothetical protein